MSIPQSIFRQYDIRGIAGTDLTEENVKLVGKAVATYLSKKGETEAVVGHDNRTTSDAYKKALIEGMVESGFTVYDIGLVVTPMCYYAEKVMNRGGVMITASHNPKEYNGFKINTKDESVFGDELQEVYRIIEREEFIEGEGTVIQHDIVTEYMTMLQEKIKLDRPLKVVVDCGNGTAALFAEKILEMWGCEVIPLYCESDGNFPNHTPDPVNVHNMEEVIQKVQEEGVDLGIGFDGDCDRLGVIDENGKMIYGDRLMTQFYKEVLEKYPEMTCLIEVKCSQVLWEECERLGGKPEFWKTGHSLIKARMKEKDAKFAGEMSGHMFFADEYLGYDDGFYAAGRILRLLSQAEGSLSALFEGIPEYEITPEVRVKTTEEDKFNVVNDAVEHFKSKYEVVDIDGARVLFPNGGWGLIRASNTQPALVVRAEAKTTEDLEAIKNELQEKLLENESIAEIDWEGREE